MGSWGASWLNSWGGSWGYNAETGTLDYIVTFRRRRR